MMMWNNIFHKGSISALSIYYRLLRHIKIIWEDIFMGENNNAIVSLYKKIHTDNSKWYDIFIFPLIITFILINVGQLVGAISTNAFLRLFLTPENTDFLSITSMYLSFWGIWAVFLLCFLIKKNRPLYKALGSTCKGNNIPQLLIGFLIGFGLNTICIIVAILHKDIHIHYDSFQLIKLLILFICVFIQSSAEELSCRVYLYQRLKRGYRHPAVAIVGNAVLFGLLHLFNNGVTPLAISNIILIGICFSLFVYYTDSIWLPMAFHAAWNFNQNIIFGLPNSGIVSPFSIFKLDASTATDSFAYNVGFGVESTILANVLIIIVCIVVIIWGKKHNRKPTNIWE